MTFSEIEQHLVDAGARASLARRYVTYLNLCRELDTPHGIYTEDHHILPRALFPQFKNFRKCGWNKIKMPMRQHIFCHIILAKMFPKSRACQSAIFQMFIKPHRNKTGEIMSALKLAEFSRTTFGGSMKDTFPVVDKISGKRTRIHRSEFNADTHWTSAYYSHHISDKRHELRKKKSENLSGTLSVYDAEESHYIRISIDKYAENKDRYTPCGKMRDQESRDKSRQASKDRTHFYNPETGERILIKIHKNAPAGFIRGMPETAGSQARESFTGSKFYHNPSTGETLRSKAAPPAGFVAGRINFGKENQFDIYSFGVSVETGEQVKYPKSEKPKNVINHARAATNFIMINGTPFLGKDKEVQDALSGLGIFFSLKKIAECRTSRDSSLLESPSVKCEVLTFGELVQHHQRI